MSGIAFAILISLAAALPTAAAAEPNEFIASYAKEHNFSGSILIQKAGSITYEKSFGLANIQLNVPNARDTKYKVASITKAFTAALILQLREQRRIDLQKPIRTYLPDYKGEAGDKVTIHQLLNHTSGIENFDKVKSAEEAMTRGIPAYQLPHTSDQLLSEFCSGPLTGDPGKAFSYNNADYIILGKIIERVAGEKFDDVLKKQILQPLKLENTGMLYHHEIVPGLANSYFMRDDLKKLGNDLPVYPENWFAAGAMYSNPRDVMTFANALFGAKLINRESLELMLTPGLDDYGYGVWSYETKIGDRKYKAVKRPGQIMGAQTQLYRLIEPDVTIVILSNAGTADLDQFVADIGRRVVSAN
ncbi:MAG TPA: serine hydrolase domain-containing protein [Chthoniobacterales bacterium]|jgi:CubicO group peptidase (beta-lactamase class C family)|nr:serine hydrolase domain-containing protein [Chthoniobacterales bacterium]